MKSIRIIFALCISWQAAACVPLRINDSTGLASPWEAMIAVPSASAAPMKEMSVQTVFAMGGKWEYRWTHQSANQPPIERTYTMEVTDVANNIVTFKVKLLPNSVWEDYVRFTTSGEWVEYSSLSIIAPISSSVETITVPAGTFHCTKYLYQRKTWSEETTWENWIDLSIGIVKRKTTFQPIVPSDYSAYETIEELK